MLDSREVSAREVVEAHLQRIRDRNPELNAFLTLTEDRAFEDAEQAQKMIEDGNVKPLTGIP